MKTIFVVTKDEAETARTMERRLLALPADSGVLFVGVCVSPDPLPTPGGARPRAIYNVFIGCHRDRDPLLMDALAENYLRDLVDQGDQLYVTAYRGVDRSSVGA